MWRETLDTYVEHYYFRFRSSIFSKIPASVGLVLSVTMFVPPTEGTIGLVLSLISLVLLTIWLFLIARRIFWLG